MTTNAFRHRPPEQCTLSKEDQQHILRISNNDQELLDELMAILRQLRPLPPRGASVRHTGIAKLCQTSSGIVPRMRIPRTRFCRAPSLITICEAIPPPGISKVAQNSPNPDRLS